MYRRCWSTARLHFSGVVLRTLTPVARQLACLRRPAVGCPDGWGGRRGSSSSACAGDRSGQNTTSTSKSPTLPSTRSTVSVVPGGGRPEYHRGCPSRRCGRGSSEAVEDASGWVRELGWHADDEDHRVCRSRQARARELGGRRGSTGRGSSPRRSPGTELPRSTLPDLALSMSSASR